MIKKSTSLIIFFTLECLKLMPTEQESMQPNTKRIKQPWYASIYDTAPYKAYVDYKIKSYQKQRRLQYPIHNCFLIDNVKATFLILRYKYLKSTTQTEKVAIANEFRDILNYYFWDEKNPTISNYCMLNHPEIIEVFYKKTTPL